MSETLELVQYQRINSMKLKVKDHNNLVRDSENMAILNTNKEAINYHNKKNDGA